MAEHNSDFSRRKFLTASLGCLAGASLTAVTPVGVAAQNAAPTSDEPGEIARRTLGRTGLKLPIVSMGAGAANDPGLVRACYEAGMRHFDTAATYAYGRNEQMVGKVLAKMGVRKDCVVGTKVLALRQRRENPGEAAKKLILSALEGSLKRLQTDYVDILYVHDVQDPGTVADAAVMAGLSEAKKSGKARFIGVSTHSDMANVVDSVVDAEIYDVVLTSINITMANDTALLGAIKNAADHGVGVIAMKTQAGGSNYPNPETLRQYSGAAINSAVFKWAMRNENLTTSIPGIGTYDHLRANIAQAGNLEYTEEEQRFLADNSLTLGMGFCHQCRKCLASCPHNGEIPDLMRTHMYATQYADVRKARRTLDNIPRGSGLDACAKCDECTARCVNAVDIPRKIEELKLIYA